MGAKFGAWNKMRVTGGPYGAEKGRIFGNGDFDDRRENVSKGGEPGPGLWVTRATYWFSSDIFSKPLFLLLFPGLDPPCIRGLEG
jgi:hypothetical protein